MYGVLIKAGPSSARTAAVTALQDRARSIQTGWNGFHVSNSAWLRTHKYTVPAMTMILAIINRTE